EEHDQEMSGDRLRVWLYPNERPTGEPTPASTQGPSRQRPHKIEAFGNVQASAPELKIHKAQHLVIRFEDGVGQLPGTIAAAPAPQAATHTVERGNLTEPKGPPTRTDGAQSPREKAPPDKTEPKKPIELWARDVSAYVTRTGEKNELREVVTEGKVHVHQDGSK